MAKPPENLTILRFVDNGPVEHLDKYVTYDEQGRVATENNVRQVFYPFQSITDVPPLFRGQVNQFWTAQKKADYAALRAARIAANPQDFGL